MKSVLNTLEKLKKEPIEKLINTRMNEFASFKNKSDNEIFNEMCFCFMTANFSAHGGIKIQREIGDGFLHLPQEDLAKRLAELKHRFPNARSKFVLEARKYKDNIKQLLSGFSDDKIARNWLADNVKGLGMKEASHFLRNIGYKNVAIIDFHIADFLVKNNIIQPLKSRSLTKKKYLEIESILEEIAKKSSLSLGELDLYLWYAETGKVLK